jgi:RNA polymerase sigma-70 factor (TIGR02960 family)
MTDTMTTMTRDGHGPMSDVEQDPVVAAAKAGDEAAFATLVARHRRELHVHCYRMVGSFEEAEDLVQETFLRAWRKRETFEGGSGFRAWLYRIATNASLDAIRLRSRRVASLGSFAEVPWLQPYPDQLLDEVAPSDDEPDAVVVARETIELTFLAVIQLLPPQQRAVLILRDVLDWSAAEAASLLDTTVAAANSALQRARATLREQLPQRPADRSASQDLSADERALLQGFIDTHERGDTAAAAAMLRDDVRVTMPPLPWLYEGRDAITPMIALAGSMGDWRLLPTRANRQPAAASYLRRPGDSVYRAFKLDVLRVEDGAIAEITTFHSDVFASFGLAETL